MAENSLNRQSKTFSQSIFQTGHLSIVTQNKDGASNKSNNKKQTTPKTNNTLLQSESTNMSTMQGSPSNNQMAP